MVGINTTSLQTTCWTGNKSDEFVLFLNCDIAAIYIFAIFLAFLMNLISGISYNLFISSINFTRVSWAAQLCSPSKIIFFQLFRQYSNSPKNLAVVNNLWIGVRSKQWFEVFRCWSRYPIVFFFWDRANKDK